jgi:hypothetical protein
MDLESARRFVPHEPKCDDAVAEHQLENELSQLCGEAEEVAATRLWLYFLPVDIDSAGGERAWVSDS